MKCGDYGDQKFCSNVAPYASKITANSESAGFVLVKALQIDWTKANILNCLNNLCSFTVVILEFIILAVLSQVDDRQ